MKRTLSLLALALGLAVTNVKAQDTTLPATNQINPVLDALRNIASGSNLMVSAYGIANDNGKDFGAGVAAIYNVNQFVGTGIRLDYLSAEKTVYMPSLDLQLQVPIPLGKFTVVPFGISGIATPIAGKGAANGSAVGIFGIGAAIRVSQHLDIVADYEKWTGFQGNQIRAGLLWKF